MSWLYALLTKWAGAPAVDAAAVDLSSADATYATGSEPERLYVGGAGDVIVTTLKGTTVTFKAVPVGTVLPIACSAVVKTGTTASNLLALFRK